MRKIGLTLRVLLLARRLRRRWATQRVQGAAAVEYALLAGMIALGAVFGIQTIGTTLDNAITGTIMPAL